MRERPSDPNSSASGPADWSAVRRCFEHCLDASPAERQRLLAALAPEVRVEVDSLLLEHEASKGQLDPDSCHAALLQAASEVVSVGHQIGGFRILRELGRGGMGTVYLAEQDSPRRHVAIKLLATTMLDNDARRRFEHEAELLGRLRHPGIAQIYAVSVHEEATSFGLMKWPFFAMEYVEDAQTLRSWAQTRPRDEGQLLRAFLEVCAAVQHAHNRGVVHRDLKPQNVLVDGNDRIKVIDFGIAQGNPLLPDDACPEPQHSEPQRSEPLTQPGELLGTLHYMAPEQIRGDSLSVDTRTDVHALGLILHELLTGRMPFDFAGRTLPEVAEILTTQDVPPLRAHLPGAGIDLELIVKTALAKDPTRRYAQAGSLAEDVERYLAHEPIQARPASLRYQLQMFTRRRRGLVLAVCALLLVATIGGASSLVFAIRAQQAEAQLRQESEQKLMAMHRVFESALHNVINLPRRIAGLPGATKLRSELIERAVEQLQYVEQHAPLDRSMRLSLAQAYYDVAKIQGTDFSGNVGDKEAGLASLERASSYIEQALAASDRSRSARILQFDIAFDRVETMFEMRQHSEAGERQWQAALAMLAALEHDLPPDDPELLSMQAACAKHRGHVAMAQREPAKAVQWFDRSRELRLERLGGKQPDDHTRAQLGALHRFTALAEQSAGQPHRALQAFARARESLQFVEQQPDNLPGRRLYAIVRTQLGYALCSRGKTTSGEEHMRWAHGELQRQMTGDPSNMAIALSLATACHLLADHVAIQGKYEADAARQRTYFEEALLLAQRGLELSQSLRDRSRDMMNILLVAECQRIIQRCQDALR